MQTKASRVFTILPLENKHSRSFSHFLLTFQMKISLLFPPIWMSKLCFCSFLGMLEKKKKKNKNNDRGNLFFASLFTSLCWVLISGLGKKGSLGMGGGDWGEGDRKAEMLSKTTDRLFFSLSSHVEEDLGVDCCIIQMLYRLFIIWHFPVFFLFTFCFY